MAHSDPKPITQEQPFANATTAFRHVHEPMKLEMRQGTYAQQKDNTRCKCQRRQLDANLDDNCCKDDNCWQNKNQWATAGKTKTIGQHDNCWQNKDHWASQIISARREGVQTSCAHLVSPWSAVNPGRCVAGERRHWGAGRLNRPWKWLWPAAATPRLVLPCGWLWLRKNTKKINPKYLLNNY